MATGHLDPGYNDSITRLRRAKSAMPASSRAGARRLQQSQLDTATLDDIREKAKDMWLDPDRTETTYGDHFKVRYMELDDKTQARPSSADRHNMPHPSE